MPMPTKEDVKHIRDNTEKLKRLTDQQLIMLALSEIIMSISDMPIITRIPLHTTLDARTGSNWEKP